MHLKWPLAWKTTFLRIGWWHYALCLGLIGLWLMFSQSEWAERNYLITAVRTAEIIIPLMAGMQVAYVFSPDDERPLEIMLAAPRPILWTIVERVSAVLSSYGAIGLATILFVAATFDTGTVTVGDMLVRWLPPFIWFSGVGLYITMVTRQGMFGSLMVMIIWGTSLLSSGDVPEDYLAIAPIMPYLRRGATNISDDLYTLNRFALVATGLILAALALRMALDNERLLGLTSKRLRDWEIISRRLRQSLNLPISSSPLPKEST